MYVCVAFSPKPAMENMDVFYSKKKMVKEKVSAALSAKAMVLALLISLVGMAFLLIFARKILTHSSKGAKLMLKCFLIGPLHYSLSYTLGWPTGCFIYFPVGLHTPNLAYLTLYYNYFVVVVDSVTA